MSEIEGQLNREKEIAQAREQQSATEGARERRKRAVGIVCGKLNDECALEAWSQRLGRKRERELHMNVCERESVCV